MLKKEKPWLESYAKDVIAEVDTRPFENINSLFNNSVNLYANNIAYKNFGTSITYKELSNKVELLASFFQNVWHLKKGDHIAIMMPNLIQYPTIVFAALKAGLTVVNVNPLYTPRELQKQLQDSDACAIAVLANYAYNLESIVKNTLIENILITNVGDELGSIKGTLLNIYLNHFTSMVPPYKLSKASYYKDALSLGAKYSFKDVDVAYDDIAFLQYTGGTTGTPKGAMLSHGNLIANVAQAYGMYKPVLSLGSEVVLTALPLYHVFALTINCLLFFHIGGSNLLITDARNIKALIKELIKHDDLTCITGVNTLFNALLNHKLFDKANFKNLHIVIGGGAAIQSGVEEEFFKKTNHHILEGYGLTECSPLCAVCPHTQDSYTGTIGVPIPSCNVRIVDNEGNEIWDLNTSGELEIAGPQVMKGYYKNDKATLRTFDDEYIRTGDIAIWQEGGYIKIIDRLKDMIIVSGFNVFPSEIEDIVSKNKKVLECAVIGVASETTGEAIKLFIVKKDNSLTEDEIIEHCRKYLTPYKVPKHVAFVKILPKSAIGKVLRRKLHEEFIK